MRDSADTFAGMTQSKEADRNAAFIVRVAVGVTVLLLVLKVVRVGDTTISDVYSWSWWVVFSPLWGLAVLAAVLGVLQVWVAKRKARQAAEAKAAVLKLATDLTRGN